MSTSQLVKKRAWLHAHGVRFLPVVGWAERGGYGAIGHGNSVPRFHVVWGTGAPSGADARARGSRSRRSSYARKRWS